MRDGLGKEGLAYSHLSMDIRTKLVRLVRHSYYNKTHRTICLPVMRPIISAPQGPVSEEDKPADFYNPTPNRLS